MSGAPKMPVMGRGVGKRGADRFAPTAKPKNAKGTIRRILSIYKQWGKTIFVAVLLTLLGSVFAVIIPYVTGKTVDAFFVHTRTIDNAFLMRMLYILVAMYAASWLVNTISGVMMLRVTQKLVYVLRQNFFDKMQRLPLSFYDTTSHGDTMSRLTNDVDNISSTIAQATTQLLTSAFTLTGSLLVMLRLNLLLSVVVLLCAPMVALLTLTIAKRSRAYFLSQMKSLGQLNGIIEENILGLKMVKAFDRQEDVLSCFADINEALYESSRKAHTWAGYMMPLMNVINNLIFTMVALVGGMLSVLSGLAVGTVVTFLNYSKQFGQPLKQVAGMFNTIQSALAGAERVFEIMDAAEEQPDATDAVELVNPVGDVAFENVSFSYVTGKPILKNISFSVRTGETIALVGETGAGKTTVVNLLTRFYDADKGTIFIDGVNICSLKRASLRRLFSVVLQDTCLFSGTIMDNIRYSKPEATDEEIFAAARMAHAHEFIEKLPNGYHTLVSGSMDNLSEGQRQLLAIARAVLCDSPILILDEATSSVDTKTEKDIQRALTRLIRTHTSFLIAHRLSTIRDADRIMVIGEGKILESGNHQQLMATKGAYYQMVISQQGKEPSLDSVTAASNA